MKCFSHSPGTKTYQAASWLIGLGRNRAQKWFSCSVWPHGTLIQNGRGGKASAPRTALAPGQTLVLRPPEGGDWLC